MPQFDTICSRQHQTCMETLLSLLIFLVIVGLIWWLLGMLPLPAPIRQAVNVLFVVIVIVYLLYSFAPFPLARHPLLR
jgi:hypothetical protein